MGGKMTTITSCRKKCRFGVMKIKEEERDREHKIIINSSEGKR
jgi:hypothetical protein